MKKLLLTLLVLSVFLVGCGLTGNSIADIKENPNDFVGEEVTLRGTSDNRIILGSLAGFTLEQEDGSTIAVSDKNPPENGNEVTVKGTVMKDTLFGIYILAEED